jgi:hypothetical protein
MKKFVIASLPYPVDTAHGPGTVTKTRQFMERREATWQSMQSWAMDRPRLDMSREKTIK